MPELSLVAPRPRRKLLSPSVGACETAAATATGAGFFCVWRVCLALSKHSLQMYRPCWSLIRGLPEQGLGAGLGLPREYGLCGGMSLAAADFYLANKPVPDFTKPPAQGTPLYEYMYQRQADSMGPLGVMALKFWGWMRLPDHSEKGECTQKLTAQ